MSYTLLVPKNPKALYNMKNKSKEQVGDTKGKSKHHQSHEV